MRDPERLSRQLNGFEARLAALTPRSLLDRDRLMFAAGCRAGQRRLRVYNGLLATASMLLAGVAVAVILWRPAASQPAIGHQPPTSESPLVESGAVARSADAGDRSIAALDGPTLFRLRKQFERGAFAEPAPHPRQPAVDIQPNTDLVPPTDARSLLKQYLEGSQDHS